MLNLSCHSPTRPTILAADVGQTLFWEGDTCTHVYEVRSGIVRGVNISEEGERQVTAFFFVGDQIGIPVYDTYRYSAEPITSLTFVRHPRGLWCETMIENLRQNGKLVRSIGAEQDPVFRRGMLIGRGCALSRVAAFLISVVDRLEPRGAFLSFPLPQIDIAAYLATSPETVCRSLKKLRNLGIIEMPAHDLLVVLDRFRLERAAHTLVVS